MEIELERFDVLKLGFYQALGNRDFKSAKEIVDDFGPQNEIEKRVKHHYEGRYLAALGMYNDAVEQMQLTIRRYGSNIQIQKDLAWLYRQLGEEKLWVEATNRLTDDFNATQKKLSLESRLETLMQLFNERMDQGFVSIATKIFERLEQEETNEKQKEAIRRTRLRILVLLNDESAKKLKADDTQDEYLRTLLYCQQASSAQVHEPLKAALASTSLSVSEKSHLFHDVADLQLLKGIIPSALYKKINKASLPKPLTYFELNVQSLIFSLAEPRPIYWFKYISSPEKISAFDELRILTLQRRYGNERVQTFADFQMKLRFEKLDVDSQVMWSHRLK